MSRCNQIFQIALFLCLSAPFAQATQAGLELCQFALEMMADDSERAAQTLMSEMFAPSHLELAVLSGAYRNALRNLGIAENQFRVNIDSPEQLAELGFPADPTIVREIIRHLAEFGGTLTWRETGGLGDFSLSRNVTPEISVVGKRTSQEASIVASHEEDHLKLWAFYYAVLTREGYRTDRAKRLARDLMDTPYGHFVAESSALHREIYETAKHLNEVENLSTRQAAEIASNLLSHELYAPYSSWREAQFMVNALENSRSEPWVQAHLPDMKIAKQEFVAHAVYRIGYLRKRLAQKHLEMASQLPWHSVRVRRMHNRQSRALMLPPQRKDYDFDLVRKVIRSEALSSELIQAIELEHERVYGEPLNSL